MIAIVRIIFITKMNNSKNVNSKDNIQTLQMIQYII